jgi:hypothetical protein
MACDIKNRGWDDVFSTKEFHRLPSEVRRWALDRFSLLAT